MDWNAQSPLRDEASRLVGAARGADVQFPVAAPLRDIEKAWIYTCQQHESRRQLNSSSFAPGTLEHRTLSGLERCATLTAAHLGVLTLHGGRGARPDLNCEIASRLWTEAMEALAAEVDLREDLVP